MGTLFEDQHTFMIISPSILHGMKSFRTEVVEEMITFYLQKLFLKIVPFMR